MALSSNEYLTVIDGTEYALRIINGTHHECHQPVAKHATQCYIPGWVPMYPHMVVEGVQHAIHHLPFRFGRTV
ncbi:MAG: hypothetical protein ACR2OE_08980 [Thermomicrobiales bacterium]